MTPAISSDTVYYLNFADGSFDFHGGGFRLAVLLVRSKKNTNHLMSCSLIKNNVLVFTAGGMQAL